MRAGVEGGIAKRGRGLEARGEKCGRGAGLPTVTRREGEAEEAHCFAIGRDDGGVAEYVGDDCTGEVARRRDLHHSGFHRMLAID
jgi:hypothetical protein